MYYSACVSTLCGDSACIIRVLKNGIHVYVHNESDISCSLNVVARITTHHMKTCLILILLPRVALGKRTAIH